MLVAERSAVRLSSASTGLRWPSDSVAVFCIAAASYLILAAILTFGFQIVTIQALGEVANAQHALLSRDPHLAALGFVSGPLPALFLIPLLSFQALWAPLGQAGFAACITSSVFMAGAAYQLHQMLAEGGVPRAPRLVFTGLFAVHPLIVFVAATGRGEALYLFFLVLACRHLSRWLRVGDMASGVLAGFALAGAYLTRYDAAIAVVGAMGLVTVFSLRRTPGAGFAALCDALIVGAPTGAAIVLWGIAGWMVTGNLIPQLSSSYGYLPQLDALRGHVLQNASGITGATALVQVLSIEPALPAAFVLLMSSVKGNHGRQWLPIVGTLGPLFAAVVGAILIGWAFPWSRLLIVEVPLMIVLTVFGLIRLQPAGGSILTTRFTLSHVLAAVMLAAAVPTSLVAMVSARTGQEEAPLVSAVIGSGPGRRVSTGIASARSAAQYLDSLHEKDGAVLIDSFAGFPVILSSSRQRQFVITSDRDFAAALREPAAFGVRYLLVPAPDYLNSLGSLDALNRTYPNLFSSTEISAGFVDEFRGESRRVEWRLYRVSSLQPSSASSPSS